MTSGDGWAPGIDPIDAEQVRLGPDIAAVQAYCERNTDTSAGIRWESDGAIRIVVAFTAHMGRHRRALAEIVQHSGALDVRLARYTVAEVDALRFEIHHAIREHCGPNSEFSTGIDIDTVSVSLSPDAGRCAPELRRRFGDVVEIEPWPGERRKLAGRRR